MKNNVISRKKELHWHINTVGSASKPHLILDTEKIDAEHAVQSIRGRAVFRNTLLGFDKSKIVMEKRNA